MMTAKAIRTLSSDFSKEAVRVDGRAPDGLHEGFVVVHEPLHLLGLVQGPFDASRHAEEFAAGHGRAQRFAGPDAFAARRHRNQRRFFRVQNAGAAAASAKSQIEQHCVSFDSALLVNSIAVFSFSRPSPTMRAPSEVVCYFLKIDKRNESTIKQTAKNILFSKSKYLSSTEIIIMKFNNS